MKLCYDIFWELYLSGILKSMLLMGFFIVSWSQNYPSKSSQTFLIKDIARNAITLFHIIQPTFNNFSDLGRPF